MICYSTPRIFLLDDDLNILETISYYISKTFNKHFITICHNKRSEMIEKLNNISSTYISITDIYNDFIKNNLTLEEAFQQLKYFSPIFIVDHNLEEFQTGSEICEHIKKNHPFSHVLLLTGEVDYNDANELHNKKHIDFFIRKDNNEVLLKINEIISRVSDERKLLFNIDGEIGINHSLDVIYRRIYTKTLRSLTDMSHYESHIVLNENGDVAVNTLDGIIEIYKYYHNEGKFRKDESDKRKYYG